MKRKLLSFILIVSVAFTFSSCYIGNRVFIETVNDVPEFNGKDAYVEINGNVPDFNDSDLVTESYEYYSELDSLGRCGIVMACIGIDIMPTEERGEIGQIKPVGWHTIKYDIVDGKYLYNRCHLIGYQLTGENANPNNLITGTRYLNVEGMLPFENMVAEYVSNTENHVIYRVTPIYDDDCLVARGLQMEAKSVEDNGKGIEFNVYVYNNQPGISINYYNGESVLGDGVKFKKPITENNNVTQKYFVINTNSKKIHNYDCDHALKISLDNKAVSYKSIDELIKEGYSPCKVCNPDINY